jgi:hypothetical protein
MANCCDRAIIADATVFQLLCERVPGQMMKN